MSLLSLCRRILFTALFAASPLWAASIAESYQVEEIALPTGAAPEVGALSFDSQGTLYLLLRRGDLIAAKPVADPKKFNWRPFASGFHNGIGLLTPQPGRALVSQMGELTEASDTDGDGVADRYRTVTSDWGLSGNYHEANSLCDDGAGGYFVALGTASQAGPTFAHIKGEYSEFGRRGRNFSGVAYRGWTMHFTAAGKLEPFASGFRMQNGLLHDDAGHLWSSDNQGDWKAVTPLYHVQPGKFYGHPSSLVWDPTWTGRDPLATYRHDLAAYNAHRTRAAVEMPHLELCRSGGEPVLIPNNGSFGPFGGQMLLPDVAGDRIVRIMLEAVDGEFQGAATLLFAGNGLRTGGSRLRFSPDGKSLFIGRTVRGWGRPSEGLDRITWSGGTPFTIETMRITPSGFRLTFTSALSEQALSPASYAVRSMTYQPRWTYGSAAEDVREESVVRVTRTDDRTVVVDLASIQPGRVYHLRLAEGLKASTQESPASRDFYYTVNRVPHRP